MQCFRRSVPTWCLLSFTALSVWLSTACLNINVTRAAPPRCSGCANYQPAGKRHQIWSKTYSLSGPATLDLITPYGNIDLHSSPDKNLTVSIESSRSFDGLGLQPVEHQNGNEVDLTLINTVIRKRTAGVVIDVELPAGASAKVQVGGGGITATGVAGKLNLGTGGGGIAVEHFNGSLRAETGGGDILADGLFQDLQLQTGGGGITARIRPGSRLATSWQVRTGSGGIHVTVPPKLGTYMNINSAGGSIATSLPLADASRHHRAGELNAGGPAFDISTGGGAITVDQGN